MLSFILFTAKGHNLFRHVCDKISFDKEFQFFVNYGQIPGVLLKYKHDKINITNKQMLNFVQYSF